MFRFNSRIAVMGLALFVWAALAPGAEAFQGGPLRAGVAVVDITPQVWPIPIVGLFSFRAATEAHDPLNVRALVLDDGRTKIAIAVADNIGIPRELLDEAKQAASRATGIPVSRMLVAGTHTHTAPAARPGDPTPANVAYTAYLTKQIAKAIEEAASALQPAQIGWAVTDLPEHLHNRRWFKKEGTVPPNPFNETGDRVQMNPRAGSPDLVKPAGPVDPGLSILSVRTAGGKPLALLANYSLHYVGDVPPERVSADYFGEFAKQIKSRLAPGHPVFTGILTNGTSGDVTSTDRSNPRPPKREIFGKIRYIAGSVADASLAAYKRIEHRNRIELSMVEREIALASRKPTPRQLEFAKYALDAPEDAKLPINARSYARRALALAEGPDTTAVKLQALRIGDLGICAIPFEVFAEIGLELKQKSPLKTTFTIELANGSTGYLPTPEQHALGGYETWLGTNRVEIGASRKITDALLEMLRETAARRR